MIIFIKFSESVRGVNKQIFPKKAIFSNLGLQSAPRKKFPPKSYILASVILKIYKHKMLMFPSFCHKCKNIEQMKKKMLYWKEGLVFLAKKRNIKVLSSTAYKRDKHKRKFQNILFKINMHLNQSYIKKVISTEYKKMSVWIDFCLCFWLKSTALLFFSAFRGKYRIKLSSTRHYCAIFKGMEKTWY